MRSVLVILCLVAFSCTVFGGEVEYVWVNGQSVARSAAVAPAVQVSAPVRTRVVMVKECSIDANGNQTCRLVPRTEIISEAVAPAIPTAVVTGAVDCPCVAATGSCPCAGTAAATASGSESYAFPRVHGVRSWFANRPRLFKGEFLGALATRLQR